MSLEHSLKEYEVIQTAAKMNPYFHKRKYGNTKPTVNGIKFDSGKEARRYQELLLLEKAGKISDLRTQVRYILIPSQRDSTGKVIERPCCYIADFAYKEAGQLVVEDTKGFKTKDYLIKRKLMLWVYQIRIKET